MKHQTEEERRRICEEMGREMEEARRINAEYQIATFGRELTQEEEDQHWEEIQAERMARYKGLSIDEYLEEMEKEAKEVREGLIEMGIPRELLSLDSSEDSNIQGKEDV